MATCGGQHLLDLNDLSSLQEIRTDLADLLEGTHVSAGVKYVPNDASLPDLGVTLDGPAAMPTEIRSLSHAQQVGQVEPERHVSEIWSQQQHTGDDNPGMMQLRENGSQQSLGVTSTVVGSGDIAVDYRAGDPALQKPCHDVPHTKAVIPGRGREGWYSEGGDLYIIPSLLMQCVSSGSVHASDIAVATNSSGHKVLVSMETVGDVGKLEPVRLPVEGILFYDSCSNRLLIPYFTRKGTIPRDDGDCRNATENVVRESKTQGVVNNVSNLEDSVIIEEHELTVSSAYTDVQSNGQIVAIQVKRDGTVTLSRVSSLESIDGDTKQSLAALLHALSTDESNYLASHVCCDTQHKIEDRQSQAGDHTGGDGHGEGTLGMLVGELSRAGKNASGLTQTSEFVGSPSSTGECVERVPETAELMAGLSPAGERVGKLPQIEELAEGAPHTGEHVDKLPHVEKVVKELSQRREYVDKLPPIKELAEGMSQIGAIAGRLPPVEEPVEGERVGRSSREKELLWPEKPVNRLHVEKESVDDVSEALGGGLSQAEEHVGRLSRTEALGEGLSQAEEHVGGLSRTEALGGGLSQAEEHVGRLSRTEALGGGLSQAEEHVGGLSRTEALGGGLSQVEEHVGGLSRAAFDRIVTWLLQSDNVVSECTFNYHSLPLLSPKWNADEIHGAQTSEHTEHLPEVSSSRPATAENGVSRQTGLANAEKLPAIAKQEALPYTEQLASPDVVFTPIAADFVVSFGDKEDTATAGTSTFPSAIHGGIPTVLPSINQCGQVPSLAGQSREDTLKKPKEMALSDSSHIENSEQPKQQVPVIRGGHTATSSKRQGGSKQKGAFTILNKTKLKKKLKKTNNMKTKKQDAQEDISDGMLQDHSKEETPTSEISDSHPVDSTESLESQVTVRSDSYQRSSRGERAKIAELRRQLVEKKRAEKEAARRQARLDLLFHAGPSSAQDDTTAREGGTRRNDSIESQVQETLQSVYSDGSDDVDILIKSPSLNAGSSDAEDDFPDAASSRGIDSLMSGSERLSSNSRLGERDMLVVDDDGEPMVERSAAPCYGFIEAWLNDEYVNPPDNERHSQDEFASTPRDVQHDTHDITPGDAGYEAAVSVAELETVRLREEAELQKFAEEEALRTAKREAAEQKRVRRERFIRELLAENRYLRMSRRFTPAFTFSYFYLGDRRQQNEKKKISQESRLAVRAASLQEEENAASNAEKY
ncbi:PREDICTED: uncharacterized protein LOC106809944 [Priapulus caudatus]|uniref:Uncharacterized protein LOC106809944 n=1 Tax=Priapulus caudatus TaxID=37621 RepID=A0ABM1E8Z8_PRICU|nr:PREDICTED: uncharacterized protein LOC106809944 [Priapulus caudatus]